MDELKNSPLLYLLTGEAGEIIDQLLDFMKEKCMGKNDMSLATAHIVTAVMIIDTHCKRTGQDYDELIALGRDVFERAAKIGEFKLTGRF